VTALDGPTFRDGDPGLVYRAQQGDEAAFAELVERYQTAIHNFVFRFMAGSGTDTAGDAADLTQDVFVKAWLHLGATRPETKIGAWLYRIAANVCLDELRHRKLVVWQSWDAYLTAFHPSQVARAEEQPEHRLEAAEDAAEVRAVLGEMAPEYARLLALREFHDLQYFELAEVTGQSWGSVKSMLFRARDQFARTGAAMGVRPFGRDLGAAPVRRLGGVREARRRARSRA